MGHDHHQTSSSATGVFIVVIALGAICFLGVLGMVGGIFVYRSTTMEIAQRAVLAQRSQIEAERDRMSAQRGDVMIAQQDLILDQTIDAVTSPRRTPTVLLVKLNLEVSVDADGTLHFQDGIVTLTELEAKVRVIAKQGRPLAVSIVSDTESSVQQIAEVMRVLRDAGVNDLRLAVADP